MVPVPVGLELGGALYSDASMATQLRAGRGRGGGRGGDEHARDNINMRACGAAAEEVAIAAKGGAHIAQRRQRRERAALQPATGGQLRQCGPQARRSRHAARAPPPVLLCALPSPPTLAHRRWMSAQLAYSSWSMKLTLRRGGKHYKSGEQP